MIDRTRLRELAMGATPGPWRVDALGNDVYVVGTIDSCDVAEELSGTDAAFIAAANPAVVIELLDEIDAMRAMLEKMRSIAMSIEPDQAGAAYSYRESCRDLIALIPPKKETTP